MAETMQKKAAALDALLAARDAEWRAAVERVRESRVLEPEAMYALDALLSAMAQGES